MYKEIEIVTNLVVTIETLEDLPKLRTLWEAMNMKPNFSELARELGMDRRTVKKYYEGYQKPKTRNKPSKADDYKETIEELLSEGSPQYFCYKRHLWRYLRDNHGLDLGEPAFIRYINSIPEFKAYFDSKKRIASSNPSTIRFETEPGEQMQIDWKEDVRYITSDGEVLSLNIFVALLSYSRFAIYHVILNRKQTTLFVVLDDVFEKIGGVPQGLLNDNMRTIMDESRTVYHKGKVNAKFEQFSKDYGFTVQPCIAYHPSTKGKVETQMKLLDELNAYQGKFTFDELVAHVQKINTRKNMEIHPAIKRSPLKLFQYEKDFLLPLPSKEIRSRYYYHQSVKVNASSMISYQSNQYSVPAEYRGKTLGLEVEDNRLYLYDNTKLVTVHDVSNRSLNYHEDHYAENARQTMPYLSKEEIEAFTKKNLEKMGGYPLNE